MILPLGYFCYFPSTLRTSCLPNRWSGLDCHPDFVVAHCPIRSIAPVDAAQVNGLVKHLKICYNRTLLEVAKCVVDVHTWLYPLIHAGECGWADGPVRVSGQIREVEVWPNCQGEREAQYLEIVFSKMVYFMFIHVVLDACTGRAVDCD